MLLNKVLDSYKDKLIQATRELISIPSVKGEPLKGMPFGREVNKALEYTLKLGEELGFTTGNVDGYAGFIEFGEGDETFGILAHLDVVPEGSGWTYPPYGGEIHNNRIYGRGAIDDKGPLLAALFAMKALVEAEIPINKKVRLILGTDEESGWADMDYYFTKHPMPYLGITPDGNYPVIHAEKGIIHIELYKSFHEEDNRESSVIKMEGGSVANMVAESSTCILREGEPISVRGVSAHGSTPQKGINAIGKLLGILAEKGLGHSPIDQFVIDLHRLIGEDTSGAGLDIDCSDDVSGDLTLNLGTIKLDDKAARAVIDIRFPVKYSQGEILLKLHEKLRGTGIDAKVLYGQKPLYIPEDHFLVKTLLEVYKEQTGDMSAKPMTIGGGTYARALDTGVAFGAVFPGKEELAHQKDEYIDIDDLLMNARIYAHGLARLLS